MKTNNLKFKIAFVACNRNSKKFREDPSFVYRCENLAAALLEDGHSTVCRHISDISWYQHFDIVLFHRPRLTMRLRALLFFLKRRGTQVVADIDDLIFDPSQARYNPGVLNGQISFKFICGLYSAHKRALSLFDRITVSTEPLAKKITSLFPYIPVKILPNAVFRTWRQNSILSPKKEKIITYFSGTRSHDRDFALAAHGVERFLDVHAETSLEITGPLQFRLQARKGQLIHRDKVAFETYPHLFERSWVNLAPLESTPFTRCKSALKVIEAGFWNIPTLCSDIPDMQRFVDTGALIMKTQEDWFLHLTALLDVQHYQKLTDNLSARMIQRADINTIAQQFLYFVTQRTGNFDT